VPRRLRILTITAALAGLGLVAAAPSYAVLSAPTPIGTGAGVPVPAFTWTKVSGAASYEFVLSNANIGATLVDDTTRNTSYTPKFTIADCACSWRVRAISATGAAGAWSATQSYDKVSDAPATTTPGDGDTITYPSPVALSWDPLDGAAQYKVKLGGNDVSTLSTSTPITTSATVYTPTQWLAPGDHYWQVEGIDAKGNEMGYSTPQVFTWDWPSTVTGLTVTDTVDATGDDYADSTLFEPRFSWDPVPGAAKYDIEISNDSNWATGSIVFSTLLTPGLSPVQGTSISPNVLLHNSDYYWRVRAKDPNDNAGDWSYYGDTSSPGDTFTQTYDLATPTIENLRMQDLQGDPGTDMDSGTDGYQTEVPIVTWDPVPGASYYDVEVHAYDTVGSNGCNWSAGATWLSKTAVTSWTPLGTGRLGSVWSGKSTSGIDDGSTTKLVAGKEYCVRVTPERNGVVSAVPTVLDGTDGTEWAFQFTGYPSGSSCSPSCPSDQYVGSDDYLAPSGVTSTSTPVFTWNPIAGKQSYFVLVSTDPTFATGFVDYAFTQIPAYAPRIGGSSCCKAYADSTTTLYWEVLPAPNMNGTGANGFPGSGATSTFFKQTVAPTPLTPISGDTVSDRPLFSWTPAIGAKQYRIQVSDDPFFGSGHIIDEQTVYPTSYTPLKKAYDMGQLYWRVQAIDQKGNGLSWTASQPFTQTYPTPTFDTVTNDDQGSMIPLWSWDPTTGAASYDVHLVCQGGATCSDSNGVESTGAALVKLTGLGPISWQIRANFLDESGVTHGPWTDLTLFNRTIPAPSNPTTNLANGGLVLAWDARPGAKTYNVQISRSTSFTTNTESFATDNTSYAPLLKATDYLNGGGLYWRVAAKDADNNTGAWTTPQSLSLPTKFAVTVSPSILVHLKTTTVTVTVKSFDGHVVAGARVGVSGAGLKATAKTTGTAGKATFKLRPPKKGTITFSVTKTGYQAFTKTITSA
jgi:hypothetical protein